MSLNTHEILALSIFVVVYFFIISEIVHRTIIALLGAAVMIMSGILTQSKAISYVDFNTIGLFGRDDAHRKYHGRDRSI